MAQVKVCTQSAPQREKAIGTGTPALPLPTLLGGPPQCFCPPMAPQHTPTSHHPVNQPLPTY